MCLTQVIEFAEMRAARRLQRRSDHPILRVELPGHRHENANRESHRRNAIRRQLRRRRGRPSSTRRGRLAHPVLPRNRHVWLRQPHPDLEPIACPHPGKGSPRPRKPSATTAASAQRMPSTSPATSSTSAIQQSTRRLPSAKACRSAAVGAPRRLPTSHSTNAWRASTAAPNSAKNPVQPAASPHASRSSPAESTANASWTGKLSR